MNIIQRAIAGAKAWAGDVLGRGDSAWLVAEYINYVPDLFSVQAAASLPAVEAAVGYLTNRVAHLPISVVEVRPNGDLDPVDNPLDPEVAVITRQWQTHTNRIDGLIHLMESVLLYGVAGVAVDRERDGTLTALRSIAPKSVGRELRTTGERIYYIETSRGREEIPRDDIIFLPFRPPLDGISDKSPLEKPWMALRAALSATFFAALYYDRGAAPTTAMAREGGRGAQMDPERLKAMTKALWAAEDRMRRGGRRTMVLPDGYKAIPIGGNPQEADVSGQRVFGVQEVARIYDLPALMLGDLSRATYSNFGQAQLDAAATVSAWCSRIAMEMSNIIWPAGNRQVVFDVSQLERETFNNRMTGYKTGVEGKVLTPNEARAKEGLEPSDQPGADELQLNGGAMSPFRAQINPEPDEPDDPDPDDE